MSAQTVHYMNLIANENTSCVLEVVRLDGAVNIVYDIDMGDFCLLPVSYQYLCYLMYDHYYPLSIIKWLLYLNLTRALVVADLKSALLCSAITSPHLRFLIYLSPTYLSPHLHLIPSSATHY